MKVCFPCENPKYNLWSISFTHHMNKYRSSCPRLIWREALQKNRAHGWVSFSVTRLHRVDLQFTKKVLHDQRARSHFPKIFRTVPPSYTMNYDQAIKQKLAIKSYINPFFPNAPFLYLQKTSENFTVFWCFQGVEKGCIENEWVI